MSGCGCHARADQLLSALFIQSMLIHRIKSVLIHLLVKQCCFRCAVLLGSGFYCISYV